MLFSQLDAISDVIDDDLRALLVAEALVRIDSRLVLREECRGERLSNGMIQSSRTNQLAVCSNPIGCFCC